MELYERYANRHPATVEVLKGFRVEHLRGDPQGVVLDYLDLIERLLERLPDGPEGTVALRKLLESKDSAVRAAVYAAEATG